MKMQMRRKLTDFQRAVLRAVSKIPRGQVRTYAQIAKAIGKPKAVRAVGNALAKNPHPIRIPCHRVVRADGSAGNYSGPGGRKGKLKLLARDALSAERESGRGEIKKPESVENLLKTYK